MGIIFHSPRCLKPLKSFESTWQIEGFSSDHVLIPSRKPTRFQNSKGVKIGKGRVKIDRVRCGLGFCKLQKSMLLSSFLTALLSMSLPLKRIKWAVRKTEISFVGGGGGGRVPINSLLSCTIGTHLFPFNAYMHPPAQKSTHRRPALRAYTCGRDGGFIRGL